MNYLLLILMAGCGSQWEASYHELEEQPVWCQNYGQTYQAQVLEVDIPESIEVGEVTTLVWYLNIQTAEATATPCFQLDLYDFLVQDYIDDLSLWVQPSDGLIQPEVESGQYTLVYQFRGYQSGTVGLEPWADQHSLGRWQVNIQ